MLSIRGKQSASFYGWCFSALLISLFVVTSNLRAQENDPPSVQLQIQDKYDITERLRYYQLPDGQVPQNKNQLAEFTSTLIPHTETNTFGDRYMAILDIVNLTQQQDWFVYPSGAIVENIHIFLFRQNGELEQISTGHNFSNLIDYHYGAHFSLPQEESLTLVLLFDSDIYSSPVGVSLLPLEMAQSKLEKENLLLLVSIGVCIALALYNLFLYSGTRQRQYLYYSLATFGFTLGWSQVFGVFNFAFNVSPPEWIVIPFFFGFIFIALFTANFLQLKNSSPRLDKTLKVMAILSFVCLPVSFLSLGASLILASLFSSIILLVSLYSGIKSWRNGYSPAKYFVFALLAVLMPNIVGNFLNMGLLPGVEVNIYLLSQLGNSLDSLLLAFALAEKVRVINAQNESLTGELEQRVNERTEALSAANDKLEALIAELRDADNAKNVFLANMSHEIRTPLTSIIGYADGILSGDIEKDEHLRAVKVISQNGNHLVAIISDILDLTKVEAQKLEYERLPTKLFDIVEQVESLLKVRVREKGLEFTVDYQFPLPSRITTDPTRLKQILFNLVSNALKFTESGYVALALSMSQDKLTFSVKDTGIGMTEEQMKTLFDPFEQGDKAITRKYGGTGLGLSISKHLIIGLGGQIRVNSKPAQGSTFEFDLPISDIDNGDWLTEADLKNQVGDADTTALPDFNNAKVLLVDDHDQNRELIARLMSKMNINVIQAKSGLQAIACIEQYSLFDLILLDIQMPHMGGVETLNRIRDKGVDSPVVALTANSMRHEVEEYLQQGFSGHLSKPIVRSHFVENLKYYLTANACNKGLLSNEDMLEMTRDYFEDLKERLTLFQQSLEHSDYSQMRELSHAIKGSAGSFGFQTYSLLFSDIEQALKNHDYGSLTPLTSELVHLRNWTIRFKGIDTSRGIINHGNDLDAFYQQLCLFIPRGKENLKALLQHLNQGDKQQSRVQLLKFSFECSKYALVTLSKQCLSLRASLAGAEWQSAENERIVAGMNSELAELEALLLKT